MSLLEHAQDALNRGFYVFPLKPKSKLPATAHGFKDSSYLDQDIETWWTANPEYNIGLDLERSNLTVLDFDAAEPPAWVNEVRTLKVKTGKGLHVYFYGARPTSKMFIEGKCVGDIKSSGGYVLANGSVHPDGPIYTTIDDSRIAKAEDFVNQIAALEAHEMEKRDTTGRIERGRHDTALASIAGKMRAAGMGERAITEALILDIEDRFDDFGSDYREMAAKVARSICRYEPGLTETFIINPPAAPTTNKCEITKEIVDKQFPLYDGKPVKAPRMLIDGFLMGGVNFLGSLSGVGKTWFGLAASKALITGEPLFGVFPVKEITPVLYLIPESDEASFQYRLGEIGMPVKSELFRYRTITQGATLSLSSDLVVAAIKLLQDGKHPHVLVIVDTAIRFMVSGKDEKSATDNTLSNDSDKLRSMGADLLFLHHSPKASSKEEMTLENTLRGTGDFGAMADCVFGLRRDEALYDYGDGPEEIEVINVKTRSPEKPKPFRVRLKRRPKEGEDRPMSVIKECGTLEFIGEDEANLAVASRLDKIIQSNQAITIRALRDELHMRHGKVKELAEGLGWRLRPTEALDPKTGKRAKKFVWSKFLIKEPELEVADF